MDDLIKNLRKEGLGYLWDDYQKLVKEDLGVESKDDIEHALTKLEGDQYTSLHFYAGYFFALREIGSKLLQATGENHN
jgi:hypothetical protein